MLLAVADEPISRRTYCNPLALPNYPIGKFARELSGPETGPEWMWKLGYKQRFVNWQMFRPCGSRENSIFTRPVDMAWVSEDLGATWKHHPLNVRDLGYAPTIVRHRDRFLLMASNSAIYSSKSPLGPFVEIGRSN